MNWNFLIGPLCILVGMFVALYVKDKAQDVAKAAVSEGIIAALALFKNELLEHLDKTYIRAGECTLKMDAHDDRIDLNAVAVSNLENRVQNLPLKKVI